jgi:Domain of unknown function (DUF4091)
MAVDQTIIVRPQADEGRWNVVGGARDQATAIGRPVTQADRNVDASSYIWAGGTEGSLAAINFGTPSSNVDAQGLGNLWFYANTGNDTTLVVKVLSAGAVLATTQVPPGADFGWRNVPFPQASLTQAASLYVHFAVVHGGDSNVRAGYLTFTVASSGTQVDPRVRVVGPTDKVRPEDKPALGQPAQAAALRAAGNEAASFQIVTYATDADIQHFDVDVDQPFVGPSGGQIAPSNVRIYRVAYVETTHPTFNHVAPGRYPDPLIAKVDPVANEPRNAYPIKIPTGENRAAWIEVRIPGGTTPGEYTGSVKVTGDGLDARIPVTLTVLNFSLPQTSRLGSAFLNSLNGVHTALGYDIDTQGWQVLAMFIRAGLYNRVSIPSMLRLLRGGGDDERHTFETQVLPLVTGSDPQMARVGLPGARLTSVRVVNGGSADELQAWRGEATAYSFEDRAFVYDNPPDASSCDEIATHAGRSWTTCRQTYVQNVLKTWPQVPVLLTATIQDVNGWEQSQAPGPVTTMDGGGGKLRLCPVIDEMYGKPGSQYAGDQSGKYADYRRNPAHSLWLYSSCDSWSCGFDPSNTGWAGGYAIDAPGAQARSMPWLCFRFSASGEMYYETTQSFTSAWQPGGQWINGGNGDGNLFYPGTPTTDVGDGLTYGGTTAVPIESIRLKLAGLGYADVEYIAELVARGHGTDTATIVEQYFPTPFSLPPDDAAFQEARSKLINKLVPLL